MSETSESTRKPNHNWSDDEDEMIVQCVIEAKHNIKRSMRTASELLGLSVFVCKNRWYKHLSKRSDVIERVSKFLNPLSLPKGYEVVISDTEGVPLGQQMRESVDSFMDTLVMLQKKNKAMEQRIIDQDKRLEEQSRIMRDMAIERKEIEESYVYILKVMEKARKMFIEEEMREVSSYKMDSTGTIEIDKRSQDSRSEKSVG